MISGSLAQRRVALSLLGVFSAAALILSALGLAPLLRSLLYGVGAIDPASLASSALVLCAAALLACWLPARRASRADPAIALKAE